MTDDMLLDAAATADLVRSGGATPLEMVDAAIARIEKLNPELNAVIHERFDAARREAAGDLPRGPLLGVPVVIKDLHGLIDRVVQSVHRTAAPGSDWDLHLLGKTLRSNLVPH